MVKNLYKSLLIMCIVITVGFSDPLSHLFTENFMPQKVYPVGKNADGSEIGDIDNDGENELVVGSRGSMELHIFKKSKTQENELVLDYVHKISWAMGVIDIADINEDGLQDVIISHYTNYTSSSSSANHLGICFQDSVTHKLKEEVNFTFPSGKSSRAIDVGDIDSDGKLEIAVANEESGTNLYIFGWNSSTQQLEVEQTLGGIRGQTISIVIADITGDGKNDCISHGGALLVFEQDQNGKLKAAKSYSSSGEVAAVGDVNGDGLNDVVCNTAYGNNAVVWLQNSTTHILEKNKTLAINSYTEDVEIADLNADKKMDVVVADRDNSVLFVYYQNNSGQLEKLEKYTGESGKWLNELAVGDLNGDGLTDIIAANWGSTSVGQLYDANVSVWFQKKSTQIASEFTVINTTQNTLFLKNNILTLKLPVSDFITLNAYSPAGQKYPLIEYAFYSKGNYTFELDRILRASGVYILELKSNSLHNKTIFLNY